MTMIDDSDDDKRGKRYLSQERESGTQDPKNRNNYAAKSAATAVFIVPAIAVVMVATAVIMLTAIAIAA